jgi:hypothetical protein
VLQPTAAPPCPEVVGLPAALAAAAGGSSDNSIEVDDVLALLLAAWTTQRTADAAQLARVFGQHASAAARGVANADDFGGLVRQVGWLGWRALHGG